MPTNEERRKIATRLREVEQEYSTNDLIKRQTAVGHLSTISEAVGKPKGQTLWGRLADLIEPEEKEERGTSWWTICDECGTIFNKAISKNGVAYCPDCGTKKVVGDAD